MLITNRTNKCTANSRLVGLLFATALLLVIQPLQAIEYQASDSIINAVNDYLSKRYATETNIEYDIGSLDKRLHLTRCTQTLQVRPQPGAKTQGYTTLVVRCPANRTWQVFVPVQIRRYEKVLVARTALPRGTYLGKHDVQFVRYDVSRLHSGYFTTLDEIREMVTLRNIRQGRVLTPQSVQPPRLVRRGESIIILAKSGNLIIRVKGQALMDGRKGDTIKVRNTRSKREIQATVVSDGTVKVNI